MSSHVCVIVLNWNRPDETIECLRSLQDLHYQDYEAIVVDNGSTDDSVARLREIFPRTEVIATGENLGFGAGNNVGIREAVRRGCRYVWILNNDTTVEPDSLDRLVDACERDPTAGAATAKILMKRPAGHIWYGGGGLNKYLLRMTTDGRGRTDDGRWNKLRRVNFVPACSLLLKREAIEQVGLFRERYFLYVEDLDYCQRLDRAGWSILYTPSAVVYHTVGGSSDEPGGNSPLFDYYNTRNLLWYCRTSPLLPSRFVAATYTLAKFGRRGAEIILGRESRKTIKLRALAKGIRDGLMAKPPQEGPQAL